MEFLKKIENAIDFLERESVGEVEVSLTYAELKGIRKHLLLENYNTTLSAENLRSGMEFGKSLKK